MCGSSTPSALVIGSRVQLLDDVFPEDWPAGVV